MKRARLRRSHGVRAHLRYAVALVLPLLLLTSCGSVLGGPGAGEDLDGRTYLSTGVSEGGAARDLVEGSRVRISFEDGRLSASAGCNTMNGGYRVVDGTLVVEQLAMTEMGCPGDLMDQDTWLADLLTAEPVVAADGDRITLTTGSTVLTLTDREVADPDRPLVGTRWVVDSIRTGEAVSSTPMGAEASMVFRDDGTLQVSPGCNRGSGSYTQGEGTVTVGPVALTRMACPGPRDELERSVLEVLGAGELQVEITAASLTLTAGDRGLGLRADE